MKRADNGIATATAVAAAMVKLPGASYTKGDLSNEEWREVYMPGGVVLRIDNPVSLIMRKGGSTHRVIAADGTVYCYAAPETGKSYIRWKNRPGKQAVAF